MSDNIIFKARSANYDGYVLIWERQLGLLIKTNKTVFGYQVQEGPMVFYTVQSALQAYLQKRFTKTIARKNGRVFYKVPQEALVKA